MTRRLDRASQEGDGAGHDDDAIADADVGTNVDVGADANDGTRGDADGSADADGHANADGDNDAAFAEANRLLLEGSLAEASALLDAVAADARGAGPDRLTRARALRLAAAVARLRGDLPGAADRGRRCLASVSAVSAAAPTERNVLTELRLAATLELAGVLLLLEETEPAVDLLREAVRLVPPDDAAHAAAVRRRLAAALVQLGRGGEAARELMAAQALAGRAGEAGLAARIAVEGAALGHVRGDAVGVALARRSRAWLDRAGDPGSLTQLALLDAAQALDAGRPELALRALRRARSLALEAVLPVEYLSAATGLARVADSLGDQEAAYESLATGWATLRDLLGPDVAEASFAPELRRLRARWGTEAFAQVRAGYESRRRRARESGSVG